tara:strand:+ start:1779 stop:2468 length:690 start_codon:yes stop_codon:yes gene_type:complete
MLSAANEVLSCYHILEESEQNIIQQVLKGEESFFEWDHYPSGEITDKETHCQYFYHSHREGEHGHFHLFINEKGIPDHFEALYTPNSDKEKRVYTHLISISMDDYGYPKGFFTVNQWVTGGNMYSAADMTYFIEKFKIELSLPSKEVNTWMNALLQLYYPTIVSLLEERDKALKQELAFRELDSILLDRNIEILSETSICVDEYIKSLRNRAAERKKPQEILGARGDKK